MGLVYSPEQVFKGNLPEPGAHLRAARGVMELIKDSHQKGEIDGMIHGSVANGEAKVRSDLDILVRSHDGTGIGTILDIISTIEEICTQHNVSPEPLVVSDLSIHTGTHTVDQPYLEHLNESVAGPLRQDFVVGNPTRGIVTEPMPASKIIGRYVMAKQAKFLRARLTDTDYKNMQRALELPQALSRKFIRLFDSDLKAVLELAKGRSAAMVLGDYINLQELNQQVRSNAT
jgi:predicted nucleotidyltransferase